MPLYSQIFLNPYFHNPAMAGKDMQPAIYMWRRQQWSGIEGAPLTNAINFHSIFGRHALFGVNIYSDERSLLKTTTLLVTGGYRLTMSDEQSLNFALSAGAGFNSIDLADIDYTLLPDGDDPALTAALDNNIYLDGNAGISYQYNDFYFGISLPRLFNTRYISSDQFDIGTFGPFNNLVAMTGIKLKISEQKFAIEPVIVYHHSKYTPDFLEAYGIFHFYDMVWVGAGYRQNSAFSGFVGLSIVDHFKFGYGYEVPTNFNNGSPSFSNGSHEFQLAFLIGKKKTPKPKHARRSFSKTPSPKEATPAFTYLDDIQETKEPAQPDTVKTGIIPVKAKPGIQETPAPVHVKEKPVQTKQKPQASVKTPAPKPRAKPEQKKSKQPRFYTPLETLRSKSQKTSDQAKVKEKKKKNVEAKEKTTDKVVVKSPSVPTDSVKAPAKKQASVKPALDKKGKYIGPKQVKKGNHLLELEKGYYVVLGVFSTYEGAEEYSDELFKRGFYTKYGFVSQTKIYYVYSYHSIHFRDAKIESERLKKYNAKFRENWVLTIE